MMQPLEAIKHLCDQRKASKATPIHALYPEIATLTGLEENELKSQLNALCRDKKVKWCRTLNGTAYWAVDK